MSAIQELMGSYKISDLLMQKILSRKITTADGKAVNGISSLELDAVIYFTTISDAHGHILDFHIADLATILHCTIRSTYFILHNLMRKGFIKVEDSSWYGARNITLLDNDFSDVQDYRDTHYLNTNHYLFNFSESGWYGSFKQLSLYAKKTLLLVLSGYKMEYGYRVSINALQEKLQVKNRLLIVSYLNEIKNLLGDDLCSIAPDRNRRYKYGNAHFDKKNSFMRSDTGIEVNQDSYFKRKVRIFLQHKNIWDSSQKNSLYALNSLTHSIFSVLYRYIERGADCTNCLTIVKKAFETVGSVDDYVLRIIKKQLKVSYPAVKF